MQGKPLKRVGGGKRGKCMAFSVNSRRRLFRTIAAIPWRDYGMLCMITLTYPGKEGQDWITMDGEQAKKHLNAFRRRYERMFGDFEAVWKMEFQKRGALHWHLCAVFPDWNNGGEFPQINDFRQWVARNWYEIVGSGSQEHLEAGTGVEMWTGSPAHYFAKYVSAGERADKEYQHRVPKNFINIGRWWGVWKLKQDWQTVKIEPDEWIKCKRVIRKLMEHRCKGKRFFKVRGNINIVSNSGQGVLLNQLLRHIW